MRVAGNLAGGTREVQSTARRVDPTDATSVSLASLFSYITGLKFELFISMFVGLFCQSVPGHDGSQSLDVGGKKNTKIGSGKRARKDGEGYWFFVRNLSNIHSV